MTDNLVDVAAVADAVEAAASSAINGNGNVNVNVNETGNSDSMDITTSTDEIQVDEQQRRLEDPPPPLPRGWVMKESRSSPEYFYFYNMDTGISTWDPPTIANAEQVADRLLGAVGAVGGGSETNTGPSSPQNFVRDDDGDGDAYTAPGDDDDNRASKRQRIKADNGDTVTDSSSLSNPTEVRVLHILKKHVGSRRPASWRNRKITSTIEEAHEELDGLLEILREEESDTTELRATFEELARTESDCSSAKRGGDLGFFGRKKMDQAFEKESFGLNIGELTTTIVDTKSGSHILLRIG